jgi:hypothetical protein
MSKSADTEPNFPNIPPDREALLDELARCFVQAAVTRLLEELHQVSDGLPDKSLSIGHPKTKRNPIEQLLYGGRANVEPPREVDAASMVDSTTTSSRTRRSKALIRSARAPVRNTFK